MNKLKLIFTHLHTINKHRFYVFKYCCKVGIPFQGLVHDLSKYSPTEFFESVKYYTGTHSPIEECKDKNNGISYAWLHHKGRNKHHYEYWQDDFDKGTVHLQMPYKYVLEMLCDCIAASRVYNSSEFSYSKVLDWWENKTTNGNGMDKVTKQFLDDCFHLLAREDVKDKVVFNKCSLEEIYLLSKRKVENNEYSCL